MEFACLAPLQKFGVWGLGFRVSGFGGIGSEFWISLAHPEPQQADAVGGEHQVGRDQVVV